MCVWGGGGGGVEEERVAGQENGFEDRVKGH